jgi:hypothetical protein
MNKIATGLLTLTALFLVGLGIERIIYWVSQPLGPQFGAGEMFGIAFGIVILGTGTGVGWSARAVWRDQRGGWIVAVVSAIVLILVASIVLSTPGPPPLPVPLSVAGVVIGLAIASLAVARAAGRRAL